MKGNQNLPACDSAGTALQSQRSPPRRILVVDDEECLRELSTQVLIHSGYNVDAAEDGAVAWDTLQHNSYDLLIADNNMPNVSGVELLKKLHAARMDLPVIMVSGTIPTAELSRYSWLQIDATLLKPFTPDELLTTVRKVLYAIDTAPEQLATLPGSRSHPPADASWVL